MTHVRGETHFLPDYLSRNPTGDKESPEITTFNSPSICNKSFRLLTSEVDVKDFYIQQVAEEASKDPDYIYTVQAAEFHIVCQFHKGLWCLALHSPVGPAFSHLKQILLASLSIVGPNWHHKTLWCHTGT